MGTPTCPIGWQAGNSDKGRCELAGSVVGLGNSRPGPCFARISIRNVTTRRKAADMTVLGNAPYPVPAIAGPVTGLVQIGNLEAWPRLRPDFYTQCHNPAESGRYDSPR